MYPTEIWAYMTRVIEDGIHVMRWDISHDNIHEINTWKCPIQGADLALRQRGGIGTHGGVVNGGWWVGWAVDLKLNRKKREKKRK